MIVEHTCMALGPARPVDRDCSACCMIEAARILREWKKRDHDAVCGLGCDCESEVA